MNHQQPLQGLARLSLLVSMLCIPIAAQADSAASTHPVLVPLEADGVQRATMTMDSYSFNPNHLIVQVGKPVELTLTSVTTLTPHNFALKEPSVGIDLDQTVWGGRTAIVRFTPSKPGNYTFFCDKQLLFLKSHRDRGMEGTLEVR
ncbi:MAG: cupredoxin domain-containing protein [Nitrospiraceae bacterium]